MKKLWIKPHMEVLDVSMTMKGWPGHAGGEEPGGNENGGGEEGGDALGS